MATSVAPSGGLVPVTFELPSGEAELLQRLAGERGVSITQALRQAIVDEKYIRDQLKAGYKFLLQDSSGGLTLINWP